MKLIALALVLASTAHALPANPNPPKTNQNPCGDIPCPVCPPNDPNGCGIYGMHAR